VSLNSPADLKNILEVPTAVADPILQAFLDDANLVVTEDLAGKGLTSARLTAIEKYVAAHLATILFERGGLVSSKNGDSQDNYVALSPMGNAAIMGYALTRYGQQAMMLDKSGTLKALSTPKLKARFRVIGDIDARSIYADPILPEV
jgi:hypothetical protein